MGRSRSFVLDSIVVILAFCSFAACGGGGKAGPPLFAGRVNLTPSVNTSIALGATLPFLASVQTASGTTLNVPISYYSDDTSVLNLAPNGFACAGHWDALYTTCTPGNVGVVKVTAGALGSSSAPTYVFVHPPIDSITVTGVLLNGLPVQEPCLSQSQSMTLEAHAFSQGTEITSSVGPFAWSANNTAVVTLTPLVNSFYNFPTNQVTATAVVPGITNIHASAGGVSSTSFQQPQYNNSANQTSPVLDFFATCPIQNVSLEVGPAGSGQTSFFVSKGTSQTITATTTDVMGNSSLPNTNGGVILSKIPLSWTTTQPGVLPVSGTCTDSCSTNPLSPGAATITASCSPPSCNVGYPLVPNSLSSTAQIDACTKFFQAQYPLFIGCRSLIPVPVYASSVFITPPTTITPLSLNGAISGVVSGAVSPATVIASSTGCNSVVPANCSTSAYFFPLSKGSAGSQNPLPASPNSFLFDLAGDRIYMGSDFGAQIINPTNFGSNTSAFTSLGAVTGKILAVSYTGALAAFSDTVHTPNQVFIVNAAGATAGPTALNISQATAAAFSPDSLKTFILANNGSSLYTYSPLQALQGPIPFSGGPAQAVAFAPSGAFAFVAQGSTSTTSASLSAFATCSNLSPLSSANSQAVASLALPGSPLLMKVLPDIHLNGHDSAGYSIPDGIHIAILDNSGFDIATAVLSQPASGTVCPQGLTFISGDPTRPVQRIDLHEGTIQPVNFFSSADGTLLYVASASSSSIYIYDFIAGSVVGGIPLLGNATPLGADISIDDGTIVVAGSDGMLHEVSTSAGGADVLQLPFPNLPNYFNAFCTYTPYAGPCTLTTALIKP